ncbi:protein PAL OF QUIRKY-like isoform X2 [Amaranthus tricolor]|uniref:protein PAL OF QUIRKY-like isoform X2 n=1 Tax=Amaranthus tricolor TaxID=29722 RepID=UPI00258CFFFD|nr:protein PAL OF QUIRKY-like isoform X2 [Amaranthus tricolor]
MAAQNKIQNFSSTSKSQIKFLCSYGGKILPRPSDGLLRYVGGLTRVVSVYRSVTFTELMAKLEDLCGFPVSLRCQLPSEDLDVLISIKSNDDLFNVIEEYDKASSISVVLQVKAEEVFKEDKLNRAKSWWTTINPKFVAKMIIFGPLIKLDSN